jgi:hypothetical protein
VLGLVVALAGVAAVGSSCAATIPQAEIDRCSRGTSDGNDAYTVRQGAACRMVAQRLAADDKPADAMDYARKACQLEDASGCEQYLSLARARATLPPGDLAAARAAGEKACAGIVVGGDGADARPVLCVRTAELYLDVEPASKSDAGRLYARACKLGDHKACDRATALGVDVEEHAAPAPAPEAEVAPLPQRRRAPPPPVPSARAAPAAAGVTVAGPPPPPPCHEMRDCVTLELRQRNFSEVVGTLTSHCDHPVSCTWCPSKGDQLDKSACRSTTVGPGESKAGKDAGLWYDGYNAMAYDCMDVGDDTRCLSL